MSVIDTTSAALFNSLPTNSATGKSDDRGTVTPIAADQTTNPVKQTSVTVSIEGLATLENDRSKTDESSGYATMLKRLFYVSDPKSEPAVVTRLTDLSVRDMNYLTKSDRQTLAAVYQYAIDNKLDLTQVDYLASDLGSFRFMQVAGVKNIETKQGDLWNTDGSPRYMKMSESDSKIASRILQSDAAVQTPIDHAFIAYISSPRGGGWVNDFNRGHAVDFEFLEKFINASGGSTGATVEETKKVDPSVLDPLYKNALYRIDTQDVPLLPPDGWVDPQAEKEEKSEKSDTDTGVQIESLSSAQRKYVDGFLEMLGHRQKNVTLSSANEKKLNDLLNLQKKDISSSALLARYMEEQINGSTAQ